MYKEDKYVKQAEDLVRYYTSRMRVGHTYTIINGAKSNNAIVITSCSGHSQNLKMDFGQNIDCVTLHQLHALFGQNKPIVLDHPTLTEIFMGLLSKINKLENELSDRK